MKFILEMLEPYDGVQEIEIEADSIDLAVKTAKKKTLDWAQQGDYGIEGARFYANWNLYDQDYNILEDGRVRVDIEPDKEELMNQAGANPYCEHEWSREGEGGCDQNPGVWSTGGTSFTFASHCSICGLHKTEFVTGSQYNPGEHDTVKFYQPDSWCQKHQEENCQCFTS